jgi:hypothetical protein
VQEDDDVPMDEAMPLNVVFGDKAGTALASRLQSGKSLLPVRPSGDHVGVRVAHKQICRVRKADRYSSVARVWDVFPSHRPLGLVPVLHVSRQRLALARAKVLLTELLNELGVVERGGRGCWLGLFDSNVLGAPATDVEAGLLRLALRLIDDASLQDPERLHSSDAGEDLQNLIMATRRYLAVQEQLVHRECRRESVGRATRSSEMLMSICNWPGSANGEPAWGR